MHTVLAHACGLVQVCRCQRPESKGPLTLCAAAASVMFLPGTARAAPGARPGQVAQQQHPPRFRLARRDQRRARRRGRSRSCARTTTPRRRGRRRSTCRASGWTWSAAPCATTWTPACWSPCSPRSRSSRRARPPPRGGRLAGVLQGPASAGARAGQLVGCARAPACQLAPTMPHSARRAAAGGTA